jgi:cell division protein FtsB
MSERVRDLLCAFRTTTYWHGRLQQPSWADVDEVEAHIVALEQEIGRLQTENRHLRAEVYE